MEVGFGLPCASVSGVGAVGEVVKRRARQKMEFRAQLPHCCLYHPYCVFCPLCLRPRDRGLFRAARPLDV